VASIHIILIVSTAFYIGVACYFLIGLYRPYRPPTNPTQPFISVVIAARNEAEYITHCLTSLTQQTYPTHLFEVLVVDDASSDNTAHIVESFSKTYPHIHLLKVGEQFPQMAAKKRPMSVGIHHAKGEWIVTTDADCQWLPTHLAHLTTYMHPNTDVVIGFSQIKTAQETLTPFEKLQACDFLSLMSAAAGSANMGYPLAATGQNLAYRKTLFDHVGGFSQVAHRPSGDDVLLLQLLRNASTNKIVFASSPKTFVSTHRPETPLSFWRQRKRWASNAAFQIRLNPYFFAYILVVFSTHAFIPVGLLLHPHTPFIPLGCWLAKSIADGLVIQKGARVFNRKDLLSIWPIWEVLQPFYIFFIGIASTLGGFSWKDRYHK
jgi:cellulose synthase/poly-beta-1,6-N-acetylglucosamine synthase-like glycosyltransferase